MLDRSGAKRIAGREHNGKAFAGGDGAELADGCGLARTIDADDEDHEWFFFTEVEGNLNGLQNFRHFAGENGLHLVGFDLLVIAPGGDCLYDAGSHFNAEIGLDQDVLEFFERR